MKNWKNGSRMIPDAFFVFKEVGSGDDNIDRESQSHYNYSSIAGREPTGQPGDHLFGSSEPTTRRGVRPSVGGGISKGAAPTETPLWSVCPEKTTSAELTMQNAVQAPESKRLSRATSTRIPEVAERNSSDHLTRVKETNRITEKTASGIGVNVIRSGRELAKTGMIVSTTTMLLTGFRFLKPLNPLHRLAGVAFLGFALWHVVQNEKIVRSKHVTRQV